MQNGYLEPNIRRLRCYSLKELNAYIPLWFYSFKYPALMIFILFIIHCYMYYHANLHNLCMQNKDIHSRSISLQEVQLFCRKLYIVTPFKRNSRHLMTPMFIVACLLNWVTLSVFEMFYEYLNMNVFKIIMYKTLNTRFHLQINDMIILTLK